MKLELPSQGNCLASFTSQTFVIVTLGKITIRLDLQQHWISKSACKVPRKADIMTTQLKM